MPTYYNQIVEILKADGYRRVEGGKGSHEKWFNPTRKRTVTVPRSKSRVTANSVLKQAGIDQKI